MALTKKGNFRFGDSQLDVVSELRRYSKANGYLAVLFADIVCVCGERHFELLVDDNEGAAVRVCNDCEARHPIGDSSEFLEEAELEQCECPCGSGRFEVTVGVAVYQDSDSVRWLYLGCRCIECGLVGCYADWKNEHESARDFLKAI